MKLRFFVAFLIFSGPLCGQGLGPGNPLRQIQQTIVGLEARITALEGGLIQEGLAVVDSTGNTVGKFTGFTGGLRLAQVVFGNSSEVLVLQVDREEFFGNSSSGGEIHFESSDCSGTPLLTLTDSDPSIVPIVGVWGPGNTVYKAELGVVPSEVRVFSRLARDGTCVVLGGGFHPTVPSEPLLDLDTLFTSPFTVIVTP